MIGVLGHIVRCLPYVSEGAPEPGHWRTLGCTRTVYVCLNHSAKYKLFFS